MPSDSTNQQPTITKDIRNQIKELDGVAGTGGEFDGQGTFIVYLEKDAEAVRDSVLAITDPLLTRDKVRFITTGSIVASAKK